MSSGSSAKTIIYSTEIKYDFWTRQLIFQLIGSYCLSFLESILIFHDFPWATPKFQDFPGLENEIIKFHDFPGSPWPVRTLLIVHVGLCVLSLLKVHGNEWYLLFLKYEHGACLVASWWVQIKQSRLSPGWGYLTTIHRSGGG